MDHKVLIKQLIIKLSHGNPGAATFLVSCFKYSEDLFLDVALTGLKGSAIWVLYSDLCFNDFENVKKLVDNCPIDIFYGMLVHVRIVQDATLLNHI